MNSRARHSGGLRRKITYRVVCQRVGGAASDTRRPRGDRALGIVGGLVRGRAGYRRIGGSKCPARRVQCKSLRRADDSGGLRRQTARRIKNAICRVLGIAGNGRGFGRERAA